MNPKVWSLADRDLNLDRPLIVGILNVTPDSFSDGGAHLNADAAITAGLAMVADGAAIVDVGGESTRPGSIGISAQIELQRVLPVIEGLAAAGVTISVDTSKAEVARACIGAGAGIVNDVTALSDPEMAAVCAESGVGVVLMHMRGTPETMHHDPTYEDVVREVKAFLESRADTAIESGISVGSMVVDPGFGFGKTVAHNVELLNRLDEIVALGYPVVVGTSRKGFLGSLVGASQGETTPQERDDATNVTTVIGVSKGATIFRVHNVRSAADVARTANAIVAAEAYG